MARQKSVNSSHTLSHRPAKSTNSDEEDEEQTTVVVDNRTSGKGVKRRKVTPPSKSASDDELAEDETEAEYEVERIVKHTFTRGVWSFKVRWKGYGVNDDTWEPFENLESAPSVLRAYFRAIGKGYPFGVAKKARKSTHSAVQSVDDSSSSNTTPARQSPKHDETDSGMESDELPKAKSWERLIEKIDTVSQDDEYNIVAHIKFKNGKEKKVLSSLVRKKAPQRLIDFYENHLNFNGGETTSD